MIYGLTYIRSNDMDRFVYFAEAAGFVKIGCSHDPEHRVASFSSYSPIPLEIVARMKGGFETERAFHLSFSEYWSHGEWFRKGPRLADLIDAIAKGDAVDVPNISGMTACNLATIATKKEKSRLTRMVNAAEDRRYGRLSFRECDKIRPENVKLAIRSYSGGHAEVRSEAVAVILFYVDHINSEPYAPISKAHAQQGDA